nr:unnamed protein product [Callosobruchus analis]
MSQIKICHVNVRSLLNRFNEFKQQVFNKYDIIAVTETWLTDNIADSAISIVGYKIFRYDRLSRGGGVAVYVKTNIKAVLIKIDINTIEQLWVRICAKNEMIAFGILYRPPSFPVNNFIHILEETIAHLYPTYPGIIIAGDLNIDFLSPNSNSYLLINNLLQTFDITQVINQPTRIGPTSFKLIDIIACSKPLPENLCDVSAINAFFINATKTNDPDLEIIRHFKNTTCENVPTFSFEYTSEEEIYRVILSIKSQAIGHDQISINMLLYCCPFILQKYCLTLNPSKSVVMLFGRRQAQRRVIHKISIKINSVGIPLTNKTKNLGVYIDTSLTFSDHISHILKRGYSSLKSLYSSRKILSKKNKIILTEALVLSHANYANAVYTPSLRNLHLCQYRIISISKFSGPTFSLVYKLSSIGASIDLWIGKLDTHLDLIFQIPTGRIYFFAYY